MSSSFADSDEPVFFDSLHRTPKRHKTRSVSSKSQCSEASTDLLERSVKSLQQRKHNCNFALEEDTPDPFARKTPKSRGAESLKRRITETQDRRRQMCEEAEMYRAFQEKLECPFTPTKVSTWTKKLPYPDERRTHNCAKEEAPIMMNEKSRQIIKEMGEKRGIWARQGPVLAQKKVEPPSPFAQPPTKHSRAATQRLYKSGIRTMDVELSDEWDRGTPKPRKVIMETTDRLFRESLRPRQEEAEEEEERKERRVRPIDVWTLDQETRRFVKRSVEREREAEYRRQYREIQEIADCESAPKDLVVYSHNGTIPRDMDAVLHMRSMYRGEYEDEYTENQYRNELVRRQFEKHWK